MATGKTTGYGALELQNVNLLSMKIELNGSRSTNGKDSFDLPVKSECSGCF